VAEVVLLTPGKEASRNGTGCDQRRRNGLGGGIASGDGVRAPPNAGYGQRRRRPLLWTKTEEELYIRPAAAGPAELRCGWSVHAGPRVGSPTGGGSGYTKAEGAERGAEHPGSVGWCRR
jgi:hypothetical protein